MCWRAVRCGIDVRVIVDDALDTHTAHRGRTAALCCMNVHDVFCGRCLEIAHCGLGEAELARGCPVGA